MPNYDEPKPLDRQLYGEILEYVTKSPDREKAAERRHQELVKATQAGFKLLADTFAKGFGQIADALRQR